MKKILLLFIPVFMSVSCDDNETIFPEYFSSFTFIEKEMTVYAGEVGGFTVKAKQTVADDYATVQPLKVIEDESTAVAGTHFNAPEKMMYEFPAKSTAEQSIGFKLIPENITEEIILVLGLDFDDIRFVDDGEHIDKIKIHIIPGRREV